MKKWISATRPWSLPASVMPALIALAYAFYRNDLALSYDWIAGIAALFGAAIFHLAGNLISDYHDYTKGVDSHENIGATNLTIVDGVLRAKTVLYYGYTLLIIGILIGLWLTFRCGWPILYIGMLGSLLTLVYYRFKFSALGDFHIFISFGLIIPFGTFYALTGKLFPEILLISSSIGFLIVDILHANNTRDRQNDNKAGIKTFAMLLGLKKSKIYYTILILAAYLLVLIEVAFLLLPIYSLVVLLTLPIGIRNIRSMVNCKDMTEIAALDGASAGLVSVFSLLLALSCFITPIL